MEKSEKYFLIPLFSGAITSVTYFRLGKLVPLPYFLIIRAAGLVFSTKIVKMAITISNYNRDFGAKIR